MFGMFGVFVPGGLGVVLAHAVMAKMIAKMIAVRFTVDLLVVSRRRWTNVRGYSHRSCRADRTFCRFLLCEDSICGRNGLLVLSQDHRERMIGGTNKDRFGPIESNHRDGFFVE